MVVMWDRFARVRQRDINSLADGKFDAFVCVVDRRQKRKITIVYAF